jgi:hypothetical protein
MFHYAHSLLLNYIEVAVTGTRGPRGPSAGVSHSKQRKKQELFVQYAGQYGPSLSRATKESVSGVPVMSPSPERPLSAAQKVLRQPAWVPAGLGQSPHKGGTSNARVASPPLAGTAAERRHTDAIGESAKSARRSRIAGGRGSVGQAVAGSRSRKKKVEEEEEEGPASASNLQRAMAAATVQCPFLSHPTCT